MSRRKILVLAGTGIVVAVALGCYVPQYYSPIPELAQELHACLEPTPDEAPGEDANVDPSQHIQVELRVISFNATRAGTPLFADRLQEVTSVGGLVKDNDCLAQVLERLLNGEQCGTTLALPRFMTVPGQPAQLISGGEIAVLAADGVSVESRPFGTLANFTATLRKDGLIHLRLRVTRSEPNDIVTLPNGTSAIKGLDSVHAETSLALNEGQTAFIVSPTLRIKDVEDLPVPLLGDLPNIGSWFSFRRQVDFDEQLLILATPRRTAVE